MYLLGEDTKEYPQPKGGITRQIKVFCTKTILPLLASPRLASGGTKEMFNFRGLNYETIGAPMY
jgi:hypothetical protein